jgi:tetratricopeptide (TPR) repeat protein
MPLISRDTRNRLLWPDTREKEAHRAQMKLADSTTLDERQVIEMWATLGEAYKYNKESQLSEQAYLKALDIIKSSNDTRLLATGYKDLGDALYFCRDYSRAILYYDQSAAFFENLNDTTQLVMVFSQAAYAHSELQQRDEERRCLYSAVNQSDIDPLIKATLLERLALSFGSSGQTQQAINIYESALTIYESQDFIRGWPQRIHNLAALYTSIGDDDGTKRTLARIK